MQFELAENLFCRAAAHSLLIDNFLNQVLVISSIISINEIKVILVISNAIKVFLLGRMARLFDYNCHTTSNNAFLVS